MPTSLWPEKHCRLDDAVLLLVGLSDAGWSKATMVELARRYSNNLELLTSLTRIWRHIHGPEQDTPEDDLTLRSATQNPARPQTLSLRLTPDTIAALLADYQARRE